VEGVYKRFTLGGFILITLLSTYVCVCVSVSKPRYLSSSTRA
jgi:hypothetical protein